MLWAAQRDVQLPPFSFGRRWSRFLHAYYNAPDHPAKLRIIGLLERLTGNRRVVVPTRWGFEMAVDKRDFVQRTIFSQGVYEPEVTELLLTELMPTDVFYDIGANTGYYTCAAAAKGVQSIYAFEPDPLSCSVLLLNLRLNDVPDNQCVVFQFAVGDKNANRLFHRAHVSNTGQSGFQERNAVQQFESKRAH